jgi:hypothetical protein
LEPPLEGQLTVEGNALQLISDGWRPIGNGGFQSMPPYTITMTGNQASFNMVVPIDDYYITVTDAPAVQVLSGDYNGDGAVDAADYVAWRKGAGAAHRQVYYETWRASFGGRAADESQAASSVPEPTPLALSFAALLIASLRRHSIH